MVVAELDRMLCHLADTCSSARLEVGVTIARVALLAHVDVSTVRRFEKATAHSYPDHLDELVGAYAQATHVNPVDLWAGAVRLWATRVGGARRE